MTLIQRLNDWRARGHLSPEQYENLSALVLRDRFSVFFELHTLLYLGVISFVGGLGWTVRARFAQLGDLSIILGLTVICAGSWIYCFYKGPEFSRQHVESPNFIFDYVLYLGCLVYSVDLGFVEFRYHILAARWDLYLLASAVVLFLLAYRFDNRFVLSLALSTLAAWFGIKLSHIYDYGRAPYRVYSFIYGLCVGAMGAGISRCLKSHFQDTYLQIAAHALLLSSLSGVVQRNDFPWLGFLMALVALSAFFGIRSRRFSFVTYAMIYGYAGLTALVYRHFDVPALMFVYVALSGPAMIVALVVMARRFGDRA